MNSIRELHEKAMDIAERAYVARIKGDHKLSIQLSAEAYQYEEQAARLMPIRDAPEPTRSVLYRSAASLAVNCGELREAERLIAEGLAGNPPEEIAEELRELYEEVNLQRHLELRGVSLGTNEMQVSVYGNATSSGFILMEHFMKRIILIRQLIWRTIERLYDKPYYGGPPRRETRHHPLSISVPRPASFAISLRVGSPKQLSLPFMRGEFILEPEEIIEEMMTCLDLFNDVKEDDLHARIKDPTYYRNFVVIAKTIAPDGYAVKQVGFTAFHNGKTRAVSLHTPRSRIKLRADESSDKEQREIKEVVGMLLVAYARTRREPRIEIEDDQGNYYKVSVTEGMDDIVRSYFGQEVKATGYTTGREREIDLIDISEVE